MHEDEKSKAGKTAPPTVRYPLEGAKERGPVYGHPAVSGSHDGQVREDLAETILDLELNRAVMRLHHVDPNRRTTFHQPGQDWLNLDGLYDGKHPINEKRVYVSDGKGTLQKNISSPRT